MMSSSIIAMDWQYDDFMFCEGAVLSQPTTGCWNVVYVYPMSLK